MNKEELLQAFQDAIPDMEKDLLWCSEATNSLGFVKTKQGKTCELVITLVGDPDDWIRDEDSEENTLDLTKEKI